MDVRTLLTFLLPFLKEVVFGKPVYEEGTDKRTIHSNIVNYFQKSRRATAFMILVVFFLAGTNVYTFQKLATVATVSRENIARMEQACKSGDYTTGATDKPIDELDLEDTQEAILRHLGH